MRRALEFFCAIASRCSKQMAERENLREYEVAGLWMLSPPAPPIFYYDVNCQNLPD